MSAIVIKFDSRTATNTDQFGRQIAVRKLSSDQIDKLKSILGEATSNEILWLLYVAICSVISINGKREKFPSTRWDLDCRVDRVEEQGIEAAIKGLQQLGAIVGDRQSGNCLWPHFNPGLRLADESAGKGKTLSRSN
ncbi:MAG: hypothetical protein JSR89_18320 [Proteobacteria bacterium]|nr:hypothetical protein [Pseudomonadota bacterium]